jgi:hypothetical protein
MNLRPFTLWRSTARTPKTNSPPGASSGNAPLNELFDQYTRLAAIETELQNKIEALNSRTVINAQRLEKVKLGQAPGALQGTALDL